jgi:hypothetical protein
MENGDSIVLEKSQPKKLITLIYPIPSLFGQRGQGEMRRRKICNSLSPIYPT